MKTYNRRSTDLKESSGFKTRVGIALNHILLCLLFLVGVSMVTGFYLYKFDANPPVVINNSPIPTDKDIYHLGDDIYVTFDYCRYTDVPVTRYISFTDGLSFQLPPLTVSGGNVGCDTNTTRIATIPLSLPLGDYSIEGKSEYQVNFLATRIVTWKTQEFTVIR